MYYVSSLWQRFERSDFARSIPFGNRQRPAGFSLAELPPGSLSGRVVLITGASAGLGKETAAAVAAAGAVTVLGCRNEAKGRLAEDYVRERAPDANVSTLLIDLSSRASIERAVDHFKRQHAALHVLVNNGGIPAGTGSPLRLVDGVEECFQVNHLAHFQLTLALLPLLESSARDCGEPSRVVHVSSSAHRYAPQHEKWLSVAWLNDGAAHSMVERYGMAKLAQLAFSTELDRRLRSSGSRVLSNAVHPGIVATELVTANATANFGSALGLLIRGVMTLRNQLMAYSVADGALTQLFAAASSRVTAGGGYFVPIAQPWPPAHPLASDAEFGARLWEFSLFAIDRETER